MNQFCPDQWKKRLGELELEENIIREGYMLGAGVLQAMIIVERLNEIVIEREYILASLNVEVRDGSTDPLRSCEQRMKST